MAAAAALVTTSYYHSTDDIKNFRIRVLLRELASAELISASPRTAEAVQELLSPAGDSKQERAKQAPLSRQEQVLTWQQVVHRPSSRDLLRRRIFTSSDAGQQAWTTRDRKKPRKAAEKERRSPESEPSNDDSVQWFIILADLTVTDNGVEKKSIAELCRLSYDGRGQLTCSPTFCSQLQGPYRTEGGGGVVFEYVIQNVSKTRTRQVHKQILSRPRLFIDSEDWHEESWVATSLRLTVLLELSKLLYCNVGSALYLCYSLHLPSGWRVENASGPLEGVTHVCRCLADHSGVCRAVFSTPVTATLALDDSERTSLQWPALLVAAFAECPGDAESDLGYAYLDLQPQEKPGTVRVTQLWLPRPQGVENTLRQVFLPGSRLLPSADFLAPHLSNSKQMSRVSRFGLATHTTCSLHWTLHTLISSKTRQHALTGFHSATESSKKTQEVLAKFRQSARKLRLATAAQKT